MKRTNKLFANLSLTILLLAFFTAKSQTNNPPKAFQFSFYGYVDYEMVYDSRQVVTAREANVLLFPRNTRPDPDGKDLNAVPNLNFTVLSSRAGTRISGPEALGAKTEALFEVDFFGTRADNFGLVRLRHAMIKLSWEKTEMLAGQYWHPLFIPECFPNTVTFAGGVPYFSLNRAPQFRLSYITGKLRVTGVMLTHSDFPSLGPEGPSSTYIRNSGIPETLLQAIYRSNNFLAGATLGFQVIRPRTFTKTEPHYASGENMITPQINAFSSVTFGKTSFKVQAYYNENNSHVVMLGGYGEASLIDEEKGMYDYSGLRVATGWAEIETSFNNFKTAIMCGYAHNFGSEKAITGEIFARGADIAYMYRISPRIVYTSGKTQFGLELMYDRAFYGTPDAFYRFTETKGVSNLRSVFLIKYNFAG